MITRGIGTVAKGMQALIDFEDVTAHNLANVTTNGYKTAIAKVFEAVKIMEGVA